jgi:hypothetical protein
LALSCAASEIGIATASNVIAMQGSVLDFIRTSPFGLVVMSASVRPLGSAGLALERDYDGCPVKASMART